MNEYEDAVNSILVGRPEITREELDRLIEQKLEKIGGGFLTKRGAVHLVAADLGVQVPKVSGATIELKDAHDGSKDVSFRAKVLNISPVRQFTSRDGAQGSIRTMTVYDNGSRMGVKMWNEKATMPEIEKIAPGDIVKIAKAYVKDDMNGTPAINIGSGATVERDESQESDIGGPEMLEVDASTVAEDGRNLVVVGRVFGQISDSEFTRKSDGKRGTVLRMSISGSDGNSLRAILWGKTKRDIPKFVPLEAKVRIIGVDGRTGNQGLEVHGNDATILEVEGTNDVQPRIVRIISKATGEYGTMVLGVDSDSKYSFIADNAKITANFDLDDIVELMPTSSFGSSMILDATSYAHKTDTDAKIPTRDEMSASIESVVAGNTYAIKAIILKVEERREIQTRAGATIALAEVYVEDSTGPIWVKGWRNQADLVAKCVPGEVYVITGLNARAGMEGRIDLMLSPYSVLSKQDES